MPNTNNPVVVKPASEEPLYELLRKQLHLMVDLANQIKDVDQKAVQLADRDSLAEPLVTLFESNQEEDWQQILNAMEKRFNDIHDFLDQVLKNPCPRRKRTNSDLKGQLHELLLKKLGRIIDLTERIQKTDGVVAQLAVQDLLVGGIMTLETLEQAKEWRQVLAATEEMLEYLLALVEQMLQFKL